MACILPKCTLSILAPAANLKFKENIAMWKVSRKALAALGVAAGVLITCQQPATAQPAACAAQSANPSNFNGTSIQGGSFIWFNANLTASGIPSTGATVFFQNSTI